MQCQQWSSPEHKVIPWDGGWLDWDLHDSRGYLWLEDLVNDIKKELEHAEMMREKAREAAKGFVGNRPNA